MVLAATSQSLPRWLVPVAAIAAAWLGWQVIGNAVGATAPPAEALSWRPGAAPALVALGEGELRKGPAADFKKAEALATDAITNAPLNQRALRLLGLAVDFAGDSSRAASVMAVAGERSRRDAGAELWLLQKSLKNGAYSAAASQLDAILRSQPDLVSAVTPNAVQMVLQPQGVAALVDVLGRDPPWRGPLLNALAGKVDAYALDAMLAKIDRGPTPLRRSEVKPFLTDLVAAGRFDLAYVEWARFLPQTQQQSMAYVYNGGFELGLDGSPFDWSLATVPGAVTQVRATGDADRGNALRIVFANTRVAYRHTSEFLTLTPGTYRLSGKGHAVELMTARGLTWRIRCASKDATVLAETALLKGSTPWQGFAVDFTVPDTCPGQILVLEIAADVPSEERIGGEVWYDDLAIEAVTPNTN